MSLMKPGKTFHDVESLDIYYSPTPNGWKVTILLHETGIPYTLKPVDLTKGEQFTPEFERISPNKRMPALECKWKNAEVSTTVFESGAVMLFLCDLYPHLTKTVCPPHLRKHITEWLFWMNANLGPNAGQVSHFTYYAPRLTPKEYDHGYALNRYKTEYERLVQVLERRLAKNANRSRNVQLVGVAGPHTGGENKNEPDPSIPGPYVVSATDYTIADMSIFPWVNSFPLWMKKGLREAGYPYVEKWRNELKKRPGLRAGIDVLKKEAALAQKMRESKKALDDGTIKNLFKNSKL